MDIKKYIYGHCVSPVKVSIWDAYSQTYILRELPCGKCLHCANTHINEWCTRLFAQRKYSKYCYFVSLDYAPFTLSHPVSYQLAKETAACYHNINKRGKYGMHPLVLCKNHLQDFFKRLRKHTDIKLQYFACGEYGTHAEGCGYGRPHFHCIVFSNDPITENDFNTAWTIKGYKIGRVDFVDMNSVEYLDQSNNLKIFKYVCKYLQKADFDFEKLATIDFHRAFFESIYLVSRQTDLFHEKYKSNFTSDSQKECAWRDYIREYSPFIVCSRRPAIGAAYLAENLERFKTQDFRLFGLPLEGTAFPHYFLRKTKESLCDFVCTGSQSEKPSSSSRLGSVVSLLNQLYAVRLSIDNWSKTPAFDWCICKKTTGERQQAYLRSSYFSEDVPLRAFNFYDSKNKFFYQFDGYHYNVWCKLKNGSFSLLDKMDIYDVLSEISPSWVRFHNNWLTPLHDMSIINENELNDYVTKMYKPTEDKSSFDLFRDEIYSYYQSELSSRYKTKLLMQNSKTTL